MGLLDLFLDFGLGGRVGIVISDCRFWETDIKLGARGHIRELLGSLLQW